MLACAVATSIAGQDDKWPSLSYLRHDYNQSKIVARVQVREAEIVNRIGGYEDWRLVCDIVEPFKGRVRKGQEFVFYHGAEAGFKKETFLGDKIIFLIRNYVEKENKWVYAVIENSTLPYNEDRGKKLRTIARSLRRRQRTALSVPTASAVGIKKRAGLTKFI
jgi:hypothetical protein